MTSHSFSLPFTFIIFNSTVYAVTATTGDEVWASSALGGVCQGSVQPTSDGENVYVIYNSDAGTVGHFTVLDNTGADIYTFDDPIGPFSPMGVYAEPSPGGNFLEGTGNTNTLAIWGYTPSPGATTAETGGTFAFQMPVASSVAGPNVTVLIAYPTTDWRSTAPPLLTSMGQQMFWAVSRSKLRSWTAVTFKLGADGGVDFGRGTPLYLAAPYTPAVNDNDDPTIVCGGAANSSFSCMEPTGDPYELSFVNEFAGLIYANPFFSTGSDRVYYVDNSGTFYSVDPTTGAEFWNAPTGVTIQANVGMTSDGAFLFFGDTTGNILAWQIADSTLGEVTTPPGAGGGDGAGGESAFPESGAPTTAPMPNGEPSASTPTSPTTSGAVSTAVFSVIVASAVAAVTFF